MRTRFGRSIKILWIILISCLFLTACESYNKQESELPDTFRRGRIRVSADESFKPIIDAQVQVYEARFPDARIIVDYKPEADCLRDMLVDSIRVVIVTRKNTEAEKRAVADSLKRDLESLVLARDAIAVITNPQSEDSFFTMKEIKDILRGSFKKNLIPVFDGVKATSTIRFIIDSVLRGENLTNKAVAARSSQEVVDYIARTPGTVGFIGVSWVGNKDDTAQLGFLKKVKMCYLESVNIKDRYVIPLQINIADRNYPMVRDLVYILKEKHKGLGHGFTDFMSGEIGQLIFKRAYLMPAQRDFILRRARLRE
ncbi:MAG TPA: substrate-binding domain-containing protein [Chitinophagaceae bacterium]|nr:substrate-binding domain-containing protein [Chitinophagaceae bacterium]